MYVLTVFKDVPCTDSVQGCCMYWWREAGLHTEILPGGFWIWTKEGEKEVAVCYTLHMLGSE